MLEMKNDSFINEEKTDQTLYDVCIIGAGIIGTMLARELMRYRLKVLLLEQDTDVAMGATKGNSAIVHGGYAESNQTLKGRLCYQGRKKFPKLEEELNFGFDPCGSIVVAFDEADLAGLEALRMNGLANGINPSEFEIWDAATLQARVPGISTDARYGLFCAGAGICSPYVMTIAAAENAVKNGLVLKLNEGLISAERDESEEGFILKSSQGQFYRTKRVVNCAGLGAEKVANLFGVKGHQLYGRSGEYILLDRGTSQLVPHVLFGMPTPLGKGILISQTVHGNLILGPDATELRDMTAEEAATRGLDTHEDRLLRIWEQANELFPNLPAAKIIRDFAGVRAAEVGGDFVIGADPDAQVKGYYQALGIQSPGLTAAPAIADLLIQIMAEEGLELEANSDFDPIRKAYITPLETGSQRYNSSARKPLESKELEALLRLSEGEEGRMVCRCEQVSEEAVLSSLDQGVPVRSLDAVKRRTRAGMGRCQGLYCRSRVASLLAQHLGLKLAEVEFETDVEEKRIARVGAASLKKAIRQHTK